MSKSLVKTSQCNCRQKSGISHRNIVQQANFLGDSDMLISYMRNNNNVLTFMFGFNFKQKNSQFERRLTLTLYSDHLKATSLKSDPIIALKMNHSWIVLSACFCTKLAKSVGSSASIPTLADFALYALDFKIDLS